MKTIPVNLVEQDGERLAEVMIYDVIGSDGYGGGVSAKNFAADLAALGDVDAITVRINSPGGSVFQGNAIYNALVRHKAKVRVEIDGIAASAASYIAMAGDEINIAQNATMMIHCAQGLILGPAKEMRKVADELDKLSDQIADIYAARTGRKRETWMRMMEEETYFTAEEAVKAKLADSMTPNKKKPAMAHLPAEFMATMYRDPERMAALLKDTDEETPSAETVAVSPQAMTGDGGPSDAELEAAKRAKLAEYAARAAEVQA